MATVESPASGPLDPTRFLSHPDALYEIEDGRVVELPKTSQLAYFIARHLHQTLTQFLAAHSLGIAVIEAMFVLDPSRDLRRRPDVAFVASDRWSLGQEAEDVGDWEVVPDLAVEVVSPHDTAQQLNKKIREYFRCGVRLV